jgi:hypothetical protein
MLIQITPQQIFLGLLKISEELLLMTCAFWRPTFSVLYLQQAPEQPPTTGNRNFTLVSNKEFGSLQYS